MLLPCCYNFTFEIFQHISKFFFLKDLKLKTITDYVLL